MVDKAKKHYVVFVRAGHNPRPRYTCEPCDVTCLRQPFMDYEQWAAELKKFQGEHGTEVHKDAGFQR